jgi:RNase P subunit RPR2
LDKELICAERKGNKLIICPHCLEDFPILNSNVARMLVKKGGGGCSLIVTCTKCDQDSCLDSDDKSYDDQELSI